jgi:hypothetical protein|tara:strand:+ start:682 stop:816 length:135 start_codon:yes stop_codon:yes gene_type:complete
MARLTLREYEASKNKKRRGVHAKSKTSNCKTSRLYKKKYRGQGR